MQLGLHTRADRPVTSAKWRQYHMTAKKALAKMKKDLNDIVMMTSTTRPTTSTKHGMSLRDRSTPKPKPAGTTSTADNKSNKGSKARKANKATKNTKAS
ncbi:Protein of unknown function [Pyronema omphalodes CBS 100304]|uniref:Uncharacterized protein n=1 Tax=Pyronema omphalodes (strain CBS 100304) TaxID=1076935 RepID=U4LN11_PYROM|nr:Protein of unknown function [Pyronema omphalodes CBS 100304]